MGQHSATLSCKRLGKRMAAKSSQQKDHMPTNGFLISLSSSLGHLARKLSVVSYRISVCFSLKKNNYLKQLYFATNDIWTFIIGISCCHHFQLICSHPRGLMIYKVFVHCRTVHFGLCTIFVVNLHYYTNKTGYTVHQQLDF